jgi:plasmid stabilization system protein ParE
VSWRVSIRAAGERDLEAARDWYENQRPGLGDEFLAAVAAALIRLETDPLRHPVYYRGFRRLLTRRFPYKLFYRVEGEAIVVFRILHASREHGRHLRSGDAI